MAEAVLEPDTKMIYLHGDLDLQVLQARSLPNMDVVSEHLRRCFSACNACFSPRSSNSSGVGDTTGNPKSKHHHHHGKIITSDPYVTVVVPQATVARTRVISNSQDPVWNERFNIPLAHPVLNLEFQVKDNDVFGAQLMGTVLIPASRVASGEVISDWFPILGPSGNLPKRDSALEIQMKFTPCDGNPTYGSGVGTGPEETGARNTYFPLRKGGMVTLYQDAHVVDGMLPKVELDGGRVFEQEKCWEDICHAISEAHHLIYVVGWSVYDKVRLVREDRTRDFPRGGDLTLGEFLKYKSEEGVRVLLLVWDDKTSHQNYFINMEGVMQTHDEETQMFFKHSSVTCVLSPRYASSKLSYIKQQVVGTLFTHHQKCVIVDTHAHGNFRKITAFLGGLDLCDGRYDTPEHRLFHDLNTVFKDDFHNPTFPPGTKAPRQPWHDLHCKIEGPAAYDVLINFEQRWRKATRWKELGLRKRMSHWHDDALIRIDRISWILSPATSVVDDDQTIVPGEDPALWVSNEKSPETWHVQVFRSIDSGSLKGFPKAVDAAHSQNLVCSKNMVIDRSIQTAYIQAIRSARHFIYIENQYFLGSSYAWSSYQYAGADNVIPMELALKIVSKIRANERFVVYIVIPMWPEGDPKSATVQEILFWQSQTMEMMYQIIACELKSKQITDSVPEDYLNFYCLGKRNELPEDMSVEDDKSVTNGVAPSKNSQPLLHQRGHIIQVSMHYKPRRSLHPAWRVSDSFKFRRFMIYVHAKGMIVDDEYVIVGSANINQRSLAGTKDTEIAMGAYQPHHSWAEKKNHPRGQIYGYRMSLWAEHLGRLDEYFNEPQSLECVRKVNEIARENWKRYTDEKFTLLQGHILKYPLQIEADGKVISLPNQETFPDIGGKILGAYSSTLPDTLTT